MKIFCEHGFYTFEMESMDDQAYFEAATGYKLTPFGERLTFACLAELPTLSIKGQPYGNLVATANYCGNQADVLRANGFVCDVKGQKLGTLSDIKQSIELWPQLNGGYIALEDMPQAGAVYNRQKLISFTGVARWNNRQFILRTYELQN